MSEPSVLFLTHTAPVPPVSGDRVRTLHLMRQLAARDWKVSLFSLVIGTALSDTERRVLEELCEDVVLQPFDRRSLRHRAGDRLPRAPWLGPRRPRKTASADAGC